MTDREYIYNIARGKYILPYIKKSKLDYNHIAEFYIHQELYKLFKDIHIYPYATKNNIIDIRQINFEIKRINNTFNKINHIRLKYFYFDELNL